MQAPCVAQAMSHPRDQGALDAVTSGIIKLPITTSSTEARNHFLMGQRELDLGQVFDANGT